MHSLSQEFKKYSLVHIMNKMKKLRQKYKVEFDKKKRSGNGSGKTWKFFDALHDILGHRPNVQPIFCIDTSTEKAIDGQDESENEDGKHTTINMIWGG